MVQTGIVTECDGDIALVELTRRAACSNCHNKDSCAAKVFAGCNKTEKVTVKAYNECGASVGDVVELTSDSAKTLGIAFCVFILPIIVGFFAYFISGIVLENELAVYVCCGSMFLLSFFALFFGMNKRLSGKITVTISSIKTDKNGELE